MIEALLGLCRRMAWSLVLILVYQFGYKRNRGLSLFHGVYCIDRDRYTPENVLL